MWSWVRFYGVKDDDLCKKLEEFNLPKCPLLNAVGKMDLFIVN